MKLTLKLVKENPKIQDFIKQTEKYLDSLGYTDHGQRHINIVADRARSIATKVGMTAHEQELSAIAAYCHDMGNLLENKKKKIEYLDHKEKRDKISNAWIYSQDKNGNYYRYNTFTKESNYI